MRIIAISVLAILCAACGKSKAIRDYSEALTRLEEYKNSGVLLYEPRYLDAQKAAAALGDVWGLEPIVRAEANSCTSDVKLYRDYVDLYGRSMQMAKSEFAPKDILQTTASEKTKIEEFRGKIATCLEKFQQMSK